MNLEIIRRICLARHYYELGMTSLKSTNDLSLFSGVNLLQDAVEAFLLAVADFVGAALDDKTPFDKYFVQIDAKISPKTLPFKNRLLQLNKMRVSSKHHGIQPDRKECQRLSTAVREFFDEVSDTTLNVNFATVSAIDLLRAGPYKDLLIEAKTALDNGDFVTCMISYRKAIYLFFESEYDISIFNREDANKLLGGILCKAPYYAKNKQYIEEHVLDPTDYIVYNRQVLEHNLMKYSIDSTLFWNIIRLTPSIYRKSDKEWVVKNDFDTFEDDAVRDNIDYIFSTTVDIFLTIDIRDSLVKTVPTFRFGLQLSMEEVPVYEKADRSSKVITTTRKGVTELDSDFTVEGLRGDGEYWHVIRYGEAIETSFGFIHSDYIKC